MAHSGTLLRNFVAPDQLKVMDSFFRLIQKYSYYIRQRENQTDVSDNIIYSIQPLKQLRQK